MASHDADPAYHAGRKAPPGQAEGGVRIGKGMPGWDVEVIAEDGAYATCARCGFKLGVQLSAIAQASDFETRPCFYCFKTSRLPEEHRP